MVRAKPVVMDPELIVIGKNNCHFSSLKKHVKETLVMVGQVGVTFSAEEFDFSQDLELIPFLTETAVVVLGIAGC